MQNTCGAVPATGFRVDQRVHFAGQPRRTGTVKYVGLLEGHSGDWIGVDWDADGDRKHDGSHNGVTYFTARGHNTASFVRPHSLNAGISLLEALQARYQTASTKEEEDEMYVLSSGNRRVSIELLGKEKIQDKLSRFEDLTSAALSYLGVRFSESPDHVSSMLPYLGVRFSESPDHVSSMLPHLKELDLTGNLLDKWEDIGVINEGLPCLEALNLSSNLISPDIITMPQLRNIRILVLNHTGVTWKQVEMLKDSLKHVEELHLMGNKLREITPLSSTRVQGFDSLRLLNLENNCLARWDEIVKLSRLNSLEQLFLNNNDLNRVWYPDCCMLHASDNGSTIGNSFQPFRSLHSLLLANNKIEELESVDSLNSFPSLMISRRERKDSEIRYVRLVMSKFHGTPEETRKVHPRFTELKSLHGIEDEKPLTGVLGPQKMASGLISISLKCIGASIGEKPFLVKKLPATTSVGKLKNLCVSFFKLKSVKPILYLQEEGSPLPTLLNDDMESLMELGVGNGSTILVDEES